MNYKKVVKQIISEIIHDQMKPTRSLEFIDITFYITPTGASFENI